MKTSSVKIVLRLILKTIENSKIRRKTKRAITGVIICPICNHSEIRYTKHIDNKIQFYCTGTCNFSWRELHSGAI